MDEWARSLRGASDAVRPGDGATAQVLTAVARRRRRRTAATTLGAAAAVAVITGTGVLVVPQFAGSRDAPPSAPTVELTDQLEVLPKPFPSEELSCRTQSKVFTEHPPFPDLAEQERIASYVKRPAWKYFGVQHAAPSALGVVALVTGDLDVARRVLTNQGVAIVQEWDPGMVDLGLDEAGQISQGVHGQLDPIVQELRRRIRGIPGYANIALWESNGAILLEWKSPVPPVVVALEQARFDTLGRVIVEPVAWSEADFERALLRVSAAEEAARGGRLCPGGQGMLLFLRPDAIGDRQTELEAELSRIAGMPVTVRPEVQVIRQPGTASFSCSTEHKIFTAEPPTPPLARPDDLERVMRKAIELDGMEGFFELARWTAAGAVLVQWKRPVPQWVKDLEDLTFEGGGRIIVEGVRYSQADWRAAMDRVMMAFGRGDVDARWETGAACQDGEGLVIGIHPDSLGDRRDALQRQLGDIAGMPVMVVPEEIVPLGEGGVVSSPGT